METPANRAHGVAAGREPSSGADGGAPPVAKQEEKKQAGQRDGEDVAASSPAVAKEEGKKAATATARPLPHQQVPQPADVYNPELERL
ncbi:hypothetical protein E2562_013653 [Oryza meyeriana var. granulata]|uniref:Uncharacterized protein n=1 Tax=Oryza meyeriana var. granulata TaxID=110450 RepID=A0A6G1BKF1_9ORYZ|nr:hypothetical protein E2562_013653 [Oryza meyeriana var. granulata]